MNYDLDKFGLSEEELFSPVDNSSLESEKITAPRYSYWHSVFRVFLRKNQYCRTLPPGCDSADDVCVSALCGVRPFRQSDERRDKTSVSSKALQQLGFNIHWILGSGASGQSTFDAVWFGSRISVSGVYLCAHQPFDWCDCRICLGIFEEG